MKIACIQLKARTVMEYQEAFQDILCSVDRAAQKGAELIIFPECAYPAYFLELDAQACTAALDMASEVLHAVCKKAKEYHVYIALGIALPVEHKLYNAAVMIDKEGTVIHRAYKSNLWHFDNHMFTPGEDFQAFDTDFGKIGMMVCADGRIPEIARILSKQGAKLIIDLVNLVATAREPQNLLNQQYTFMLPVRAMENGIWIIAVDKCGVEGRSVSYLGRSMIIDPAGSIVAECSPDIHEDLYYDIDLCNTAVVGKPDLPEQCKILCEKTENLPIYHKMSQNLGCAAEGERLVGTVQFCADSAGDYIKKAVYFLDAAQHSCCQVVVLPVFDGEGDLETICSSLQEKIRPGVVAFAGCLVEGRCVAAGLTHDSRNYFQDQKDTILTREINGWGYSVLFDSQPYIPELPRTLLLQGTELLVWMDRSARSMDGKVAQTRAAENKMFLARASSVAHDAGYIVTPAGSFAAVTFQGMEQLVCSLLLKADGLSKTVFPGTDIVKTRIPKAYKELIK